MSLAAQLLLLSLPDFPLAAFQNKSWSEPTESAFFRGPSERRLRAPLLPDRPTETAFIYTIHRREVRMYIHTTRILGVHLHKLMDLSLKARKKAMFKKKAL